MQLKIDLQPHNLVHTLRHMWPNLYYNTTVLLHIFFYLISTNFHKLQNDS